MKAYWGWIGCMAALAIAGSWVVKAVAFAMLTDAMDARYAGFRAGLSLAIPVVQLAPRWYAVITVWIVLAALGWCGWRSAHALENAGGGLRSILLSYALLAGILSLFSVTLSIDGYFYTVFGRLFGVYGLDPYTFVAPIHVMDPILRQQFSLLNNPPFPDPYGPGFTLLAGLVGRLETHATLWTQLWSWRLIAVIACVSIITALARLTREQPAPEQSRRIALFAFHPLTLYESAVGGHNDFLMLAAAIWCYALVDELPLISGLLLGVAISIKYFAALLLPFVVLRAGKKGMLGAVLVVALAGVIPALCFQPFSFGPTGAATLAKVGATLSMSLNWLLALPLFAEHSPDQVLRRLQLAVVGSAAVIIVFSLLRYRRSNAGADVFRAIAALFWSLPALHPWYATWLMPACLAQSRWALYAWWLAALSILSYAHEAVLPTPVNHSLWIVITVFILFVPIVIVRVMPHDVAR